MSNHCDSCTCGGPRDRVCGLKSKTWVLILYALSFITTLSCCGMMMDVYFNFGNYYHGSPRELAFFMILYSTVVFVSASFAVSKHGCPDCLTYLSFLFSEYISRRRNPIEESIISEDYYFGEASGGSPQPLPLTGASLNILEEYVPQRGATVEETSFSAAIPSTIPVHDSLSCEDRDTMLRTQESDASHIEVPLSYLLPDSSHSMQQTSFSSDTSKTGVKRQGMKIQERPKNLEQASAESYAPFSRLSSQCDESTSSQETIRNATFGGTLSSEFYEKPLMELDLSHIEVPINFDVLSKIRTESSENRNELDQQEQASEREPRMSTEIKVTNDFEQASAKCCKPFSTLASDEISSIQTTLSNLTSGGTFYSKSYERPPQQMDFSHIEFPIDPHSSSKSKIYPSNNQDEMREYKKALQAEKLMQTQQEDSNAVSNFNIFYEEPNPVVDASDIVIPIDPDFLSKVRLWPGEDACELDQHKQTNEKEKLLSTVQTARENIQSTSGREYVPFSSSASQLQAEQSSRGVFTGAIPKTRQTSHGIFTGAIPKTRQTSHGIFTGAIPKNRQTSYGIHRGGLPKTKQTPPSFVEQRKRSTWPIPSGSLFRNIKQQRSSSFSSSVSETGIEKKEPEMRSLKQ